jgi:glycosyltransferase involved in cell wall biosynthesis
MKLSIVIPCLNQSALTTRVVKEILRTTDFLTSQVELLVIDNGSDKPFGGFEGPFVKVIRNEKTVGVYPTFKQGFENTSGDVVAFFHSDLIIWEKDWNQRVIKEFVNDARLGMIGFIGSNEIDYCGGRGLGTTSNFQGLATSGGEQDEYKIWRGSDAKVHGKVSDEFSRAAVVDGCSMIIRRGTWNDIGYRTDFPPHHFYDRLISTQLLEKNWHIGVLGVACDHFSGQTVAHEQAYHDMAKEWSNKYLHQGHMVKDGDKVNWDSTIYQEAERRWLKEYRDEKHIVPIKI